MRRRRRAALLPPDRGLQARMVLAMLVPPVVTVGGIAAVVALLPARYTFGLAVVVVVGLVQCLTDERPPARPAVAADELPALHGMVERLCVMADLPMPEIVIEHEDHPNSWIEAPARDRPARLHLTVALVELLPADELEAVVAHELSHIAHHDARVISLVGGGGDVLLRGMGGGAFNIWCGAAVAWLIGSASRLGTLSLARHRELVADSGAAALTGRPAALACALRRISGELQLVPDRDLRAVARRDVLHLVPVEAEAKRSWPLRTHPPLEQRIARLERLEQALHTSRAAR
jgi:heat shock protein HtpX